MRNIFLFLVVVCLVGSSVDVKAQRLPTYTVLQAGGIFGIENSSDQGALHGYQFQLIVGKNFYDRVFVGLGVGNDVYRGKSTIANGTQSTRRINTLPFFADFRAPLANVYALGKFGVMANGGYAPSIGNDYFKGFMGKVGFTYAHLLAERSNLLFSAGYGFQQFDSRFAAAAFHQHSAYITVGLFVY